MLKWTVYCPQTVLTIKFEARGKTEVLKWSEGEARQSLRPHFLQKMDCQTIGQTLPTNATAKCTMMLACISEQ